MSASVLRWCLGLALACVLGACARDRLYEDTDGGSQEQDASGDPTPDDAEPDDAPDDAEPDTTTDVDAETDVDAGQDADVAQDADVGQDVGDVGQDLPDLGPGCVDEDRDGVPGEPCEGWDEPLDCDDANDARHFALREACDLVDNDCDGEVDEGTKNACGGCALLDFPPGQGCGECGQIICAGADTTRCEEGRGNACGGCGVLEHLPGDACGACGAWQCDDEGGLVCQTREAADACGGCGDPDAELGEACGPCQDGRWACDAQTGALTCQGASAPIAHHPDGDGDGYGAQGSDPRPLCAGAEGFAPRAGDCNDDDFDVRPNAAEACDGVDNDCDGTNNEGTTNACGGCQALNNAPDTPCGANGSGRWRCAGNEAVRCEGEDVNACGGSTPLPNNPGNGCGACGQFVCDGPNAVRCQDAPANACGGCSALPQSIGGACGACGGGRWACEGNDAVRCDNPDAGLNACGGCAPLAGQPGQGCGECGLWRCASPDQAACDDPGARAYFHDGDRDGYGSPASLRLCAPSEPYDASNGDDCDDSNRAIYPGATDVCDNLNNDCDDRLDEDPDCPSDEYCFQGQCYCAGEVCNGVCCSQDAPCCYLGSCSTFCP